MVRVGVIGCGWFGNAHCRVYKGIKDVNLIAVSDINATRAKETAELFKCRFYSDFREMMEKEDLDAVSIVVTPQHLARTAIEVMDYGVSILLEKPLSSNIESFETLYKQAKSKGAALMPGFIELFNPAYRELKKIIQKGELGEIYEASSIRIGRFPKKRVKWDIGVLLDLGIHEIYIQYDLFGGLEVLGCYRGFVLGEQYEDLALLLGKYSGDIIGMIEVNWITPIGVREIRVTGSRGSALLNYMNQDVIVSYTDKTVKPHILKNEPLKAELEAFVNCVKSGSNPYPSVDYAADILNSIFTAIKQSKRI